jgi:hypothetical protein
MDDGVDLVGELHKNRNDLFAEIIGGAKETTLWCDSVTVYSRADNTLKFSEIAVNDAPPNIYSTDTAQAKVPWMIDKACEECLAVSAQRKMISRKVVHKNFKDWGL